MVLCLEAPEGSTGSGSGFNVSDDGTMAESKEEYKAQESGCTEGGCTRNPLGLE